MGVASNVPAWKMSFKHGNEWRNGLKAFHSWKWPLGKIATHKIWKQRTLNEPISLDINCFLEVMAREVGWNFVRTYIPKVDQLKFQNTALSRIWEGPENARRLVTTQQFWVWISTIELFFFAVYPFYLWVRVPLHLTVKGHPYWNTLWLGVARYDRLA